MPKAAYHYLPIPLKSSKQPKYVICRISGNPGSLPLDLVITDGDSAFSKELSQSAIRKGKSTSFDGTDEEWQQILLGALFGVEQSEVELSAQIAAKQDKLTVYVQRSMDDEEFTVRLGSLEIPLDQEPDVDLIEWLIESSQATITAQTKARSLEKRTTSEHDTIEKLQKQLDTLVKAKQDYEIELLTKAPSPKRRLANAKIRELTNNGPVPEARIPEPEESPEPEDQPAPKKVRGATKPAATTRGRQPAKNPPAARIKRKRTPTPEPVIDVPVPDVEEMEEGDMTEDESVQGNDDRDMIVERMFESRDIDEGDVTEDEEL